MTPLLPVEQQLPHQMIQVQDDDAYQTSGVLLLLAFAYFCF